MRVEPEVAIRGELLRELESFKYLASYVVKGSGGETSSEIEYRLDV